MNKLLLLALVGCSGSTATGFEVDGSISGSAPVSSPTSTMPVIISGKTPDARNGAAMVSPSLIRSCTRPIASAT